MVQEAINKKTMNRHSQLDAIYRQTNKLKITLQMEYIIILLCLVETIYGFGKPYIVSTRRPRLMKSASWNYGYWR